MPTLFTALGTTYGGDGSTTFNLPDLRGRVIAGKDDMGTTSADRLTNQTGGLDGDTLGATGGADALPVGSRISCAHALMICRSSLAGASNYAGRFTGVFWSGAQTTGSCGGDSPHNNVQPTIVLNYIIKT